MLGWWQRRRAAQEQQRQIPEALWQATLAQLPFLARWPQQDLATLRTLARQFLDEKEFSGAGGLEVTDEMALAIAVQACLPVLRLGLAPYRGFVGIVLHPGAVVVRRAFVDETGIAHEYDEELAGEAMHGGPLMLSWPDVRDAGATAEDAYNLVVHEFAHVIDMLDGVADGVPPLPGERQRRHWDGVLQLEYERFCRAVDSGDATVLDPYGATAPAEFFAVAVEAFFVSPLGLREEHPWLYPLLVEFFRQDTAALAAAP
jgi:Mlc titration factor MtfA (ptsG expression regulator)